MNEESLARNLRVYGWTSVFTKRAYIPLLVVYLTEVGHLSLRQIGILGSLSAAVCLLFNVPTGYLADKWTRRSAIIFGSVCLFLAAFTYVIYPELIGAAFATFLEAIGYSVISGSREALVHDSLLAAGKANNYVRVVGRAQSFGLMINVLVVGLASLTYGVNKRLPFIIGALMGLSFIFVSKLLIEPPRPPRKSEVELAYSRSMVRVLRTFVNKYTVLLFVSIGLLSCAYDSYGPFGNLALKDLGLNPSLLVLVFASASIIGAIGGRLVHYLERINLLHYALFDTAVCASSLIAIGVSRNLYVAIISTILNIGFWRMRPIIYQNQLLKRFGHHHYKATLVSTLGFFGSINFWMPVVFSSVLASLGFYRGFNVLGLMIFCIVVPLFVISMRVLDKTSQY